MSLGGKGGLKEGLPDLAYLPVSQDVSKELAKKAGIGRPNKSMPELAEIKVSRDTSNELAKKAALVIRLFYEEERQKAECRQGTRNDIRPNLDRSSERTDEALAKKAGIGRSSMAYLLAVYRNRPDLFERVFSGEYSINKALVIRLYYEELSRGVKDNQGTRTDIIPVLGQGNRNDLLPNLVKSKISRKYGLSRFGGSATKRRSRG